MLALAKILNRESTRQGSNTQEINHRSSQTSVNDDPDTKTALERDTPKLTLLQLPVEIQIQIVKELPVVDAFAIAQTCQSLYYIIHGAKLDRSFEDARAINKVVEQQQWDLALAAERAHTVPGMSACSACGILHSDTSFSAAQLKKSPLKRKCRGQEGRLKVCEHLSYSASQMWTESCCYRHADWWSCDQYPRFCVHIRPVVLKQQGWIRGIYIVSLRAERPVTSSVTRPLGPMPAAPVPLQLADFGDIEVCPHMKPGDQYMTDAWEKRHWPSAEYQDHTRGPEFSCQSEGCKIKFAYCISPRYAMYGFPHEYRMRLCIYGAEVKTRGRKAREVATSSQWLDLVEKSFVPVLPPALRVPQKSAFRRWFEKVVLCAI